MNETEKKCFVVSPIGAPESETRRRSDQIYNRLITPVVRECGYEVERADRIDRSGLITNQVLERLIRADLVLADLSELNPNVMYELAIRHALRTPIIHFAEKGTTLPFDIQQNRTIFIDHHDLDSVFNFMESLRQHIRLLEQDPSSSDNPITVAVDLMALQRSDQPENRALGDVLAGIQDIRTTVLTLSNPASHQSLMPHDRLKSKSSPLSELFRIRDQIHNSELTYDDIARYDDFLQRTAPSSHTSSFYDEIWRSVRTALDRDAFAREEQPNMASTSHDFDDVPF